MPLKILFIGDVVGSPGRKIVCQALPRLIPRWGIGLVVCNAENAAGGSGLTLRCFEELIEAGVDVMTMGDHVYRKDEIFQIFERSDRVRPPGQLSPRRPGPGTGAGPGPRRTPVAVFTVLGRTYMRPVDCPFVAADRLLERIGGPAPRHPRRRPRRGHQRQAAPGPVPRRPGLGRAGHAHPRAHRRRADPQATGPPIRRDVGMTGPHDSIIGRRYDRVLSTTR